MKLRRFKEYLMEKLGEEDTDIEDMGYSGSFIFLNYFAVAIMSVAILLNCILSHNIGTHMWIMLIFNGAIILRHSRKKNVGQENN